MTPRTEQRRIRKLRLIWHGSASGSKRRAWRRLRDERTRQLQACIKARAA